GLSGQVATRGPQITQSQSTPFTGVKTSGKWTFNRQSDANQIGIINTSSSAGASAIHTRGGKCHLADSSSLGSSEQQLSVSTLSENLPSVLDETVNNLVIKTPTLLSKSGEKNTETSNQIMPETLEEVDYMSTSSQTSSSCSLVLDDSRMTSLNYSFLEGWRQRKKHFRQTRQGDKVIQVAQPRLESSVELGETVVAPKNSPCATSRISKETSSFLASTTTCSFQENANLAESVNHGSTEEPRTPIQPREFLVHKLILAAASPVFEAMFYGPLAAASSSSYTTYKSSISTLQSNGRQNLSVQGQTLSSQENELLLLEVPDVHPMVSSLNN
ncbi:unnamed protein product, partial [Protopolystoma xenopodis]